MFAVLYDHMYYYGMTSMVVFSAYFADVDSLPHALSFSHALHLTIGKVSNQNLIVIM